MKLSIKVELKEEIYLDPAIGLAADWYKGCPVCSSKDWNVDDYDKFSCNSCQFEEQST